MINTLEKNTLATLVYYDVLEYPLTVFEIWQNLLNVEYHDQCLVSPVSIAEVYRVIESEKMKQLVVERDGFYCLKGRDFLVVQRHARNKISFRKLRRLRRIVKLLRFVPFIRMVGVTGRLAMKNAEIGSDLDVLVVLKNKRIWIGRTLVTVLVHVLGKRRYGKKITDRICLNYFITDQTLEIRTKDWFSAHEYTFLLPLFDVNIFERFQIKNQWIRMHKPNYEIFSAIESVRIEDSRISRLARNLGERCLDFSFLENWLKRIELKKIWKNPKTHWEMSMVDASDDALIFLPSPKGPKIFDEFKQKLAKIS